MTPEEAESLARHPSRWPAPPEDFTAAGRLERRARHRAEETGMDIETARRSLGSAGLTAEALCRSCKRPDDQPHALTCPEVMFVPAEGDVEPHAGMPHRFRASPTHPCCDLCEEPQGHAIHLKSPADVNLSGWPAPEGVDPGPDAELCGEQDGETLRFCTKAPRHAELKGDDAHYDHLSKHAWRVVKSPLL